MRRNSMRMSGKNTSVDGVTDIWKNYENGRAYVNQIKLIQQIEENITAYEGKLWGDVYEATETKNEPRVNNNWVKFVCDNKTANILSGSPVIKFSSYTDENAAQMFTDFTAKVWADIHGEDKLEAVVSDASKKGTGVIYYYWDLEAKGSLGRYRGGINATTIDVRNLYVANPTECDIQKQDWIILYSRMSVAEAQKIAESNHYHVDIEPDEKQSDGADEQQGTALVTVLTKYFRIDGEVYYQQATRTALLGDVTCINPQSHGSGEISTDGVHPDKPVTVSNIKFTPYPFEIYQWSYRDGSIYGISEAEAVLLTQKTYNKARTLEAQALQANAISRLCIRDGAEPKGQKITNNPRQPLKDNCKTGQGYYYLQQQPYSQALSVFGENIINDMRVTTGSTETITGEQGAGLSAIAYAQLQAQADKPIKQKRKKLFRFLERNGRIIEAFLKIFYTATENAVMQIDDNTLPFVGTDYADIDFELSVQAGEGGEYSEFGEMTLASELYQKGEITVNEYLNALPTTVFPSKDKLRKMIESRQQNEFEQLKLLVQEMQSQIEEMKPIVQNIMPTINENITLKKQMAEMQSVYMQNMELAKKLIEQKKQDVVKASAIGLQEIERAKAVQNTPPKGEIKTRKEKQ